MGSIIVCAALIKQGENIHVIMNFGVVERGRRGGAHWSSLGTKGAQERGNPTKPSINDIYISVVEHVKS